MYEVWSIYTGVFPPSLPPSCSGYLNVFLSRWQTASDCFKAALTFDPSNIVIQNNITVCAFYMGRLKEVNNIMSMGKLEDLSWSLAHLMQFSPDFHQWHDFVNIT